MTGPVTTVDFHQKFVFYLHHARFLSLEDPHWDKHVLLFFSEVEPNPVTKWSSYVHFPWGYSNKNCQMCWPAKWCQTFVNTLIILQMSLGCIFSFKPVWLIRTDTSYLQILSLIRLSLCMSCLTFAWNEIRKGLYVSQILSTTIGTIFEWSE